MPQSSIIEWLPHVNVSLNTLATLLLLAGWVLIKRGRERAHRNVMLAALTTSTVFLVCYLVYHANAGSKPFPTDPAVASAGVRYVYLAILFSHIVLAATVPFLALTSVYLGLKGRRKQHRRVSRWTWPIWFYVSLTGVVVYLMLYQIYVPSQANLSIG